MARLTLALVVTFVSFGALRAAAAEDADVGLVRAYLRARLATLQLTAGAAEVDAALALCAEDMVYEHPAFGARVAGREAQRQGLTAHLGETRDARMTVAVLHTANHVVVARVTLRWEVKDGEAWTKGRRVNVTAFKVGGGKIAHIWDF